jgi:sugar phosphate isomerase/epimerase
MAFVLSAFADEISPDLQTQVQTLRRLKVPGLDLRSISGTNVLSLTNAQLDEVVEACTANGLHVQAIGSPVNKVPLTAINQSQELEKLRMAIHAAKRTGTELIRIFTPEVEERDMGSAWMAVEAWMDEQVQLAMENGITLIHENDARFYGAFPEYAKRLFDRFGGPSFRAAFDFANTVLIGYFPMPDWFPWLLPHLHTLHIKDAIRDGHQIVPAGDGEGQMEETLRWLVEQGWTGPLTIEPHLASAGKLGGFSGEQLFEVAVNSFRAVAGNAGVEV